MKELDPKNTYANFAAKKSTAKKALDAAKLYVHNKYKKRIMKAIKHVVETGEPDRELLAEYKDIDIKRKPL